MVKTNNELMLFDNEEFGLIRSFEKDDNVWFLASDICKCLGLANSSKALQRVDEEDKYNFKLGLPGRDPICVNEFGLYDLIFMSKKKDAMRFKKWISHEVLPSIRKHGVYISPELLEDKEVLLQKISELEEENRKLLDDKAKGKVSYADYLKRRGWSSCNVATVAADFDLSARRLNTILEEEGIQYKDEYKRWKLTPKYSNKDYVQEEKYIYGKGYNIAMKWTDKGCLFIAEVLAKHGIYPLVEKGISEWKDPVKKAERKAYYDKIFGRS